MSVLNRGAAIAEMGDDLEIYAAVVDSFLEDCPLTFGKLREALLSQDAEAVHRHAHSLKSASRTVGGEDAGEAAFILEKATGAGDLSTTAVMVDILERELSLLTTELKKHF